MGQSDPGVLTGALTGLLRQNAAEHYGCAEQGAPWEVHELVDQSTQEQIRRLLVQCGSVTPVRTRAHAQRSVASTASLSEVSAMEALYVYGFAEEV